MLPGFTNAKRVSYAKQKKPTCSRGEIKIAHLQSSPVWIQGLSKTLCSTTWLWEAYQTQHANQMMCMNLQAEGMSNVLERVVKAHCEVSKSPPKARTEKGKCRNPQLHKVILKNPWSASVQPGWSQLPESGDYVVPELCGSSASEHEQRSPI